MTLDCNRLISQIQGLSRSHYPGCPLKSARIRWNTSSIQPYVKEALLQDLSWRLNRPHAYCLQKLRSSPSAVWPLPELPPPKRQHPVAHARHPQSLSQSRSQLFHLQKNPQRESQKRLQSQAQKQLQTPNDFPLKPHHQPLPRSNRSSQYRPASHRATPPTTTCTKSPSMTETS